MPHSLLRARMWPNPQDRHRHQFHYQVSVLETKFNFTLLRHSSELKNAVLTAYHFTHWGRVTHICNSKLAIIGSDNGLSPDRRQAIIWTNAQILLSGPRWTNLNEILTEMHTSSFNKIQLKTSSGKWRPSCLGLNVLKRGNGRCKHERGTNKCLFINFILFH